MEIRVGTRGSALALAQTNLVVQALRDQDPAAKIVVCDIKTIGDAKQGTALAGRGDKKDWIYELELAILSGEIDFAVHSGKDVPNDIEPGTTLLPVLERGASSDLFVGKVLPDGKRQRFANLPPSAQVGTASLRRKASLLRLRPDLEIVEHRGNVTTRIEKLDQSPTLSGIVLAAAGLQRLGIDCSEFDTFPATEMVPAINQGNILVQYHVNRIDLTDLFSALLDKRTYDCWVAERAVIEKVRGDCKSSMGIFASSTGDEMSLIAQVMLPDGSECAEVRLSGPSRDPRGLGLRAANELLDKGAEELLERSRTISS